MWHSSMARYVFENGIFKDAFIVEFRVGNLYQVAGSPLGTMSVDTSRLLYVALLDMSQMVIGMPEFKKSMKVHV